MKKLFVVALVMSLFSAHSQHKYLSISGGYGLGIPGNEGVEVIEYTDGKRTETLKYLNFGGGLIIDVAYGTPLGKNAHFELAVGYQNNMGTTIENAYFHEEPSSIGQMILMEDILVRTINASSFRFAPGFRFLAGEGSTRGFAKVAPQVSIIQVTGEYEYKSASDFLIATDEYSRETSIGFLAALGFEMDITERIVWFSSINASLGYYSPDSWELVEYEYSSKSARDKLPFTVHEIYFAEEIEVTGNSASKRMLKNRMDYSSVALNVGVRFLL